MTFLGIVDAVLFKPLQLLFEVIYVAAYKMIQDPGLSIIALSLVMNFLILPLYMRADAMQEEEREIEKRLHPGVSHIKKTFKGDEKMMILQTYYRQNDYKPTYVLRSAVSLLLEIPFFIAAYRFLSGLELLKGVSFGPIADLGQADGLINIGGTAINLLPIVMTVVNLVSCVIFTKGSPLKTKIQLYAMAIFFLFFLYSSPSGLVFYWTLNNVFSLVKTVFYKLKHPGKVLAVLSAVCGAAAVVFGAFFYPSGTLFKRVFVSVAGLLLIAPLVVSKLKKKNKEGKEPVANKKLFFSGALFLSVFIGLTIPTSVIKSSPQEFFDVVVFKHPVWFIVYSFCIAFGAFVIWGGVFYSLVKPKSKVMFERVIWVACGVCVANYMFFGKNLGNLTPTLQFETGVLFERKEMLLNIGVIAVVVLIFLVLFRFFKKQLFAVIAVFVFALAVMVPFDVSGINKGVESVRQKYYEESETPWYTLSRDGKNVVVFMLDRAMGEFLPYLFNEKPELKEQFSGFTVYTNTVSYGNATNFGVPGLYGGYEYIPEEMNKRSEEKLVDKHNEALKMMPVLFDNEGYDVTVFDPPYANYEWIPDISIFDDCPNINVFKADGAFSPKIYQEQIINNNMRNFFMYSIMKISPEFLQSRIYDNGHYFRSDTDVSKTEAAGQTTTDASHASGIFKYFMDSYNMLDNLPGIAKLTDGTKGSFLCFETLSTHEPMLLQEPDYTPSEVVDNSEYDEANADRFTLDGATLQMDTAWKMSHYHINMASLIKLGQWFDYMKKEGVYDNTRIILVADHGITLDCRPERGTALGLNIETWLPWLLVKDFDAKEFSFSDEFMTNADVPTLATENIIENAVNPFTGKRISNEKKQESKQYIYYSTEIDPYKNNGNMFVPGDWFCLDGHDANDVNSWSLNTREAYFPDKTK